MNVLSDYFLTYATSNDENITHPKVVYMRHAMLQWQEEFGAYIKENWTNKEKRLKHLYMNLSNLEVNIEVMENAFAGINKFIMTRVQSYVKLVEILFCKCAAGIEELKISRHYIAYLEERSATKL